MKNYDKFRSSEIVTRFQKNARRLTDAEEKEKAALIKMIGDGIRQTHRMQAIGPVKMKQHGNPNAGINSEANRVSEEERKSNLE